MSRDLDELYQSVILDHNKTPRNFHELPPPASHADGHNPLCGDRLTVWVDVEGDTVKDVAFLGNHGVIVCGPRMDYAYDDLYYLERACQAQVLAMSTGRPLVPVAAAMAEQVARQTLGDRLQSELFFEALRRTL